MPNAFHRASRRRRLPRRAGWACAALALGLTAQTGASSLSTEVDHILSDERYAGAQVGIHVVAVGTGRVLYAREATRKLIAASNQKLVTAVAALETLGKDYRFETCLQAAGKLEGSVLKGHLLLHGTGDPTLGGRREAEDAQSIFKRWAAELKESGLERITGDVVADDTFFDRQFRHPDWDANQAWKWYYPTVGALAINDNCVTITVRPGASVGAPALVSISPPSAPVSLDNQCRTAKRSDSVWFARKVGASTITIAGYKRRGTKGYSGQVTVPDPSLYAAAVLKEALETEGIAVEGEPRVASQSEAHLNNQAARLYLRETPLVPVLRVMLQQSHNHYAEQVIKTVGARAAGKGSWAAGLDRASDCLQELGYDEEDFELADGCGLSRGNRLSASLLTGLLTFVHRSENRGTFLSLLAVAGESGTLRNRLATEPYRGNVLAKTGYLSGVGALSGYAETRSGIAVAFSIMVNDSRNAGRYSMRGLVDALCRAIIDHAQ
jgi:D-alanyl-D-alanine carboxypeptidase/D-alanyl-D-alanine-endopeptidase (penicillin-binding protein 4)